MQKAKWSLGLAALYIGCQFIAAEVAAYTYNDMEYAQEETTAYPRGKIVEYTNSEEFCKR